MAMRDESLLRSSSVRSMNVLPFSIPASDISLATPSTLPLTPRMYGSVIRNSSVWRSPEGMREPCILSM